MKSVYDAGNPVTKRIFKEGKAVEPGHGHIFFHGTKYGYEFNGVVECLEGWFSCRGYFERSDTDLPVLPVAIYRRINTGKLDWRHYQFTCQEALKAPEEIVCHLWTDAPPDEQFPEQILNYRHLKSLSII